MDTILATFDSPAPAVQAKRALVAVLGIDGEDYRVRIGVDERGGVRRYKVIVVHDDAEPIMLATVVERLLKNPAVLAALPAEIIERSY